MKPVKLPKEQRDMINDNIRAYFEAERGETIGHLAADNLLEFFLKELGPAIYNGALSDCRTLVGQRMQALEEDIYALEWIKR
ncbi:DUF2164 domain-containing protein [Paenibacillus tritici]|jgi:uncharacterized protein (DUF2164 family)|uniref:DUF2164 domain-containing protein n=1 Tax=Paenibacillus tritici TaxID=1873425 RepID=A0ABX2DR19_9BACL|nr:DUF2164 domain-containing protein [Paenibacillus tritici]NQX47109.1 DUF2164 domain-containing protein [Paenibacillus tritici]QUL54631.1 DUF2164 domain-containing protein [Paenibacillus tritici]